MTTPIIPRQRAHAILQSSSLQSGLLQQSVTPLINLSETEFIKISQISRMEAIRSLLVMPPKQRSKHLLQKVAPLALQISFFNQIQQDHSNKLLQQCLKFMGYEYLPKNAYVFHKGQRGRKFYVILEGEAVVLIPSNGIEQEVARYGIGGKFGQRALEDGGIRTASVMCNTDCHFAVMDIEDYDKRLKSVINQSQVLLSNFIKNFPIFKGLSGKAINNIRDACKTLKCRKGQYVYKQGDEPLFVYFVRKGAFQIHEKIKIQDCNEGTTFASRMKQKKRFDTLKLIEISQGEILGMNEMYNGLKFRNSCICNTQTGELLAMDQKIFNMHVRNNQNAIAYIDQIQEIKSQWRQSLIQQRIKVEKFKRFSFDSNESDNSQKKRVKKVKPQHIYLPPQQKPKKSNKISLYTKSHSIRFLAEKKYLKPQILRRQPTQKCNNIHVLNLKPIAIEKSLIDSQRKLSKSIRLQTQNDFTCSPRSIQSGVSLVSLNGLPIYGTFSTLTPRSARLRSSYDLTRSYFTSKF